MVKYLISWQHFKVIWLFLFFLINGSAQPLAEGQLKFMGNAIDVIFHDNYTDYWNQVTAGNAGKWSSVEFSQDKYYWTQLDNIYNYAQENNLIYKHHTLIWGQQQPGWISTLDSAEQRAEIEEWIKLVGARYPQMDMVDVVNEPLHAPPDGVDGRPDYIDALGAEGETGWDWIITAFELARQYCPAQAKLILNEYNVLHSTVATEDYLEIITLLQERDLIDAIGIQGHYFEFKGEGYTYSISAIKANLNLLAETGLPIYITEFDINEADDQQQLESMQTYFPIFWEHPSVKGITFWGYVENDMWKADAYLLLDKDLRYTERPAIEWLREYILNAPPPQGHYVADWGFIADRTAGWDFVPGFFYGDAGIAGDNYLDGSWAAIRGQFNEPFRISNDYAILVRGKIIFSGAGPSTWSGLRFGIFYHDSIGVLKNEETDSAYWSGDENHASGYLFIPPSGTNDPVEWVNGGTGNIGVINDGNAILTSGTGRPVAELKQGPEQAVLSAGEYEWAISVQQVSEKSNEIRLYFIKDDNSYWFGSVDTTIVDTSLNFNYFNSVVFALNGAYGADTSAIRAMSLEEVYVKTGDPIEIPCCLVSVKEPELKLPQTFALQQNYPNPFNPETLIEYNVPYAAEVSLKVFNMLGQEVATLFEGQQNAGNYTVQFDGTDMTSGIYMYQLKAGNKIITKKFILLR